MATRSTKRTCGAAAVALVAVLAAAPAARADSTFSAAIDSPAVAPDQPFVYRATLSTSDGQPEGFKPPDFKGLRVLGGPFMQTGMSMTMGGGGTKVENNVTWSYQLQLLPGSKGPATIGAAHVRVGGHEMTSNSVPLRLATGGPGQPARPPRPPGLFPRGIFGDEPEAEESAVSSSLTNAVFLRAVPDKKRAFVGEQVTVTWYLYLAEPQSNFQPLTQPKTDGFWTEDIPLANPQGRL